MAVVIRYEIYACQSKLHEGTFVPCLSMQPAEYSQQWRWSSVGNYYIHNLDTHETHPLIPPSSPPATVIAKWSPTGQSIAFVHANDLYILPNPS